MTKINHFLQMYSFYHNEEKSFRKTLWKKAKNTQMSNIAFFPLVFYVIFILTSFDSHFNYHLQLLSIWDSLKGLVGWLCWGLTPL